MNVTHKIKLDLQQSGARQTLHVKQGDNMSRKVELSLYDNGIPWAVQEGTVLQIAYYKPDKTGGLYDTMSDGTIACSAAGNVVTAQLHPQMFTAIGLVACELRLLSQNGMHISTFSWYMLVDAAVTDALESEDYFKYATLEGLQQQIGDLDALITQEKRTMVAAVNEVLTRAVQSVNGKTPSPTGSVTIKPENLDVALQTIPYQGTLDRVLELLAQEAMRTYQDKTNAFTTWLKTHADNMPADYANTLSDGDYRIVSYDSEYLYHKFTAGNITWLTEWTHEDDAILYFTVYCNGTRVLSYDSSNGVEFSILSGGGATITGLALPKMDSDAANKAYVDSKTRSDVSETFAVMVEDGTYPANNARAYIETLPDGDYRIVSADKEHIFHKFTAGENIWIAEWEYPDDTVCYCSVWCNNTLALSFSNDDGICIGNQAVATTEDIGNAIKDATDEIWDYLSLDIADAPNYWERVQHIVRAGKAAVLFPVGYEFKTLDADTGNEIIWVVRGHDHHKAADKNLKHSMTLETKYVYSSNSGSQKVVQYDAQEALYYAAEGLAAGSYHFTVVNRKLYPADNDRTFQFTLANAVPAGGQVVVSATYDQTLEGKSVTTYAGHSTAAIEMATLTEGAAGTSLGATDGTGNINHMHRIDFGSNNYAQSALRQWLNSAADVGSVWTPTNRFDRAPSWAASYNGFLHGLPVDFLAVVESTVIPCRTNSKFECASLDGTEFAVNQVYNLTDRFFPLSQPEIYGSWDNETYKDGELLDFYSGLTDTERRKYDDTGTVRSVWLRTPLAEDAALTRVISTGGSASSNYAFRTLGVAPACIIA